MDYGTILVGGLAAAAGAFGKGAATKFWSLMKSPKTPDEQKLFPNGEKTQIIRAIKDLKAENEARRDEIREQRRIVDKIAAHLKIDSLE